MVLSRTIKALTMVVGLYSSVALAGQQLHLKIGKVDTSSRSQLGSLNQQGGAYHILQFKNVITASDRQQLLDSGVEIISYIPDDAYLVKVPSHAVDSLKANRSV